MSVVNISKKRSAVAFYGNTQLKRVWCEDCGSFTFVRDNIKVCCGEEYEKQLDKYVRMSEPEFQRREPKKREKEEILAQQDGRCFYCEMRFGSIRHRNGKPITLRIHWDHQLPYVYSANNKASNFVAACHVCNLSKSSHVFQEVDEAKVWLANRRKEKGYDF